MTWIVQHWLAVTLFVLYSAALFYNAWLGKRRTRDVADYFVGGRGMGGVAIGISFYATFASTNSYIGHAGKGYAYGVPWLLMAGFLVIFAYLSWLVPCLVNSFHFSVSCLACGEARPAGNGLPHCQGMQQSHKPGRTRPSGVHTKRHCGVTLPGNMLGITRGACLALALCVSSEIQRINQTGH